MITTRRRVEELAARYILEPSIGDIFVEGPEDPNFISWFLEAGDHSDYRVYPIDTVEIANDVILSHGYNIGPKGRVLTLSRLIAESALDDMARPPLFIVDRDVDEDDLAIPPNCLVTDYSSLEMYAMDEACLLKLIRIHLKNGELHPRDLLTQVIALLSEVSTARRLARQWNPPFALVGEIHAHCREQGGTLSFSTRTVIERSMNACGLRYSEGLLETPKAAEFRSQALSDPRRYSRGHDYVEVLSFCFRKKGLAAALSEPRNLVRLLYSAIDRESLLQFPLFQQLLQKASAPAHLMP